MLALRNWPILSLAVVVAANIWQYYAARPRIATLSEILSLSLSPTCGETPYRGALSSALLLIDAIANCDALAWCRLSLSAY